MFSVPGIAPFLHHSAVPPVASTVEAGLPAVGKLGCRRKRSRADVVEDQRAPDRHPAHSCGREGRRDDLFGRHRLVGGDDHGGRPSRPHECAGCRSGARWSSMTSARLRFRLRPSFPTAGSPASTVAATGGTAEGLATIADAAHEVSRGRSRR